MSLSSSGRVGVSAGPVSVYGGGRRRRGGGSGGLGAFVALLIVVGLVITYWYVALPLAVAAGAIAVLVHRSNARALDEARRLEAQLQAEARRQRALQQQAWLAGPPPPLPLPSRFTERWFEDNVPNLHPGQVPLLIGELKARGWKDDRISQRVGPFLAHNPHV